MDKHGKRQTAQSNDSALIGRTGLSDFRSEKRTCFTELTYRLRHYGSLTVLLKRLLPGYSARHLPRLLKGFLPVAIIVAGTVVALMMIEGGVKAALLTAVTACLSALSILVANAIGISQKSKNKILRNRFENLEDKAWELQESEERYRAIAEVFGDALVMRNADGIITFCNQAFTALTGKSSDEVNGKAKLPREILTQVSHSGDSPGINEIHIDTPEGQRWFEWHDLPVRDEKTGVMGMLSVARDITAFRQSRKLDEAARVKAEEASSAKSRFLAMVSHEMRTPLNGIIGMSKLLAATRLTPEQKNYSSALMTSGENLLGLIDGMLDLTMIEAGHFEIKTQQFDIHDLLNKAVELLSPRAYSKGIDCGLFIDPAMPQKIETDPGRLRQIIFNLAGNAIKFTNSGGISIRCLLNWIDQKPYLRIEVVDTGPGLSISDRERIFNEFERVDNAITRSTDGAGLGLAISRALVQQMGGSLVLQKSDQNGSVFVFEVPMEIPSDVFGCDSQKAVESKMLDDTIFLIISQATLEMESLVDTLSSQGAKAEWINNDQELADRLNNGLSHYTAIFFDPHLWHNPLEIIQGVKNRQPTDGQLIILTLPERKADLVNFQNHGADSWLVRPIRKSSLLTLLAKHPKQSKAKSSKSAKQTLSAPKLEKPMDTPSMVTPIAVEKVYSGRVLLAEDNDINALLVTAALGKRGIQVTRVHNGHEAAEVFIANHSIEDTEKFTVILMDMHMPHCDGYSATQTIRKFEAENAIVGIASAHIFALTADEQNKSKARAIKAGVDGFLVKPIDPVKLCDLVEQELEKITKGDKCEGQTCP